MSKLKFTDGMEFDLSGPYHKEHRSDGWYIVGEGSLIPTTKFEADKFLAKKTKRIIDLDGPDGNVFALMAIAFNLAKYEEINPVKVMREMAADDYNNALKVFYNRFKDYVTLTTKDEKFLKETLKKIQNDTN